MAIFCSLQVWFKNRRAKWRKTKREEEASRRSEEQKRKVPSQTTSGQSTSALKDSERIDVGDERDVTSDTETRPASEVSYSSKDNRNDSFCESDISCPSSPVNLRCNTVSGDEQELPHDTSREGSSWCNLSFISYLRCEVIQRRTAHVLTARD